MLANVASDPIAAGASEPDAICPLDVV